VPIVAQLNLQSEIDNLKSMIPIRKPSQVLCLLRGEGFKAALKAGSEADSHIFLCHP